MPRPDHAGRPDHPGPDPDRFPTDRVPIDILEDKLPIGNPIADVLDPSITLSLLEYFDLDTGTELTGAETGWEIFYAGVERYPDDEGTWILFGDNAFDQTSLTVVPKDIELTAEYLSGLAVSKGEFIAVQHGFEDLIAKSADGKFFRLSDVQLLDGEGAVSFVWTELMF